MILVGNLDDNSLLGERDGNDGANSFDDTTSFSDDTSFDFFRSADFEDTNFIFWSKADGDI